MGAVIDLFRKRTAHDFALYNEGTIGKRIKRWMAVGCIEDSKSSLELLTKEPGEVQRLAEDRFINVSRFFRDEEAFALMAKKVVPELVRAHPPGRPIRVWVAGCSTGEEAYSIAMLFLEEIEAVQRNLKLQIFASDIDGNAVAFAREGLFPASIEADILPSRLARFFTREDQCYRVTHELRATIVFSVHDLISEMPFLRLDLISCRDLLICLRPEAQRKILSLFHFALDEGGIMFLGSSDTVRGSGDYFKSISHKQRIYRHIGRSQIGALELPLGRDEAARSLWVGPARPAATPHTNEIAQKLQELDATRKDLENAIRDREVAEEEINAINEEAMSVNEELNALKDQMRETVKHYKRIADDLENILTSAHVATLFLDEKLNIRLFTSEAKSLFGDIAFDVGRPLAEPLGHLSDQNLLMDAQTVLTSLIPITREIEAENGACYTCRLLPYRTKDNRVEGVVITFVDVTERKRAVDRLDAARLAAESANLGKSRFLAAVSHDLRQPLQTLTLLHGIMAKKITDPSPLELVARSEEALMAMSGMLNTLLDINQLEAGVIHPEVVEFPINNLLERLKASFKYNMDAHGLQWRVIPSRLMVRSDPRLLEQMIRNLLSNAVKFTRQGGVLLGCRRQGGKLSIEVWDTGRGIPEEQLCAIFQEYHQIDNPERELSRGLGLTIVQRLGDLLGHAVTVRSRENRGSVFAIEVPLSPRAEPIEAVARVRTGKGLTARRGEILVVEDDPDIREALETLLKADGHRLIAAADGEEAISTVAQDGVRPDMAIVDYNLPRGMTGVQVMTRFREMVRPDLPGLILTGDISTKAHVEIAKRGYIHRSKPIMAADLAHIVQELLAKSAQVASAEQLAGHAGAEPRTVVVIDDDDGVREALRTLLQEEGMAVEIYASGEALLGAPHTQSHACLLIDATMPGMGGIELLRRLKDQGDLRPAILITGDGDLKMAVEAMRLGIVDFIEKPISREALLASIERAMDHPQDSIRRSSGREAAARLSRLTPRERQVMDLVLTGAPSKNIGADLGVSQRTVESHRAAIMKKTGSKSLPELVRLVIAAS